MSLAVGPCGRRSVSLAIKVVKRGLRGNRLSSPNFPPADESVAQRRNDFAQPLADGDFKGVGECQHNRWKRRPKAGEILRDSATYLDLQSETSADEWSTPLYPKANFYSDQTKYSFRPKVDPRETSIILFPGQATQHVGMGRNLVKFPNVTQLYSEASEILGYDLLKLCCEGPEAELSRTVCSQPAIFVSSLATLEQLREERPKAIENCIAAAGYSVGEYAALVFAGSLTFEAAVRLVKARAEAMQVASEAQTSALATVFLTAGSRLGEACRDAIKYLRSQGHFSPVCQVATHLFTEAKVIGGHDEAIHFVEANAKRYELGRVKRLSVSGAFHTPIMQPAAELFRPILDSTAFSIPLINVHSNVDGKVYLGAKDIRQKLLNQLCHCVMWEQLMHILYDRSKDVGFPQTYECGPGTQLGSILRRTNMRAASNYISVAA